MVYVIIISICCMQLPILQGMEVSPTKDSIKSELTEIQELWLKQFPSAIRKTTPSFVYWYSDIKDPLLNTITVWTSYNEHQIKNDINNVLSIAADRKTPFIFSEPNTHGSWNPTMQSYNLANEQLVAMVHQKKTSYYPSGNNVTRLAPYEIDLWMQLFNTVFKECDPEFTKAYSDVIKKNLHKLTNLHSEHYCAYLDGKLVGIGSLSKNKNYAEISNIAVIKSARRKGIATSIVHTLIQRAYELQASHCILTASSAKAEKLYEKIGFIKLCTMNIYLLNHAEK